MTKQRFSSSMQILVTTAIFLLLATGDSLAQPAPGSRTGKIDIRNEGQVLSDVGDIVAPDVAYFIKSKGSQKVMDVAGGSIQTGAVIRQLTLNGSLGQKFSFTDAGGGFFFLRSSTGGHFLTLHNAPPATTEPAVPLPPA